MPPKYGRKPNHKGRSRHWLTPEEAAARGLDNDSSSGSDGSGSGSGSDSEDEIGATEQKEHKPKGVEGLIEIENPNLIKPKMKKASDIDLEAEESHELSRKERIRQEEAKQKKAEEAVQMATDMERLALVRKQREDAAKRKEEERKLKEEELKAKAAALQEKLAAKGQKKGGKKK